MPAPEGSRSHNAKSGGASEPGRISLGNGESIPASIADVREGDFLYGKRGEGTMGYVVGRGVLGRGNNTEVFRIRNPFRGEQFIPISEARIAGLGQ